MQPIDMFSFCANCCILLNHVTRIFLNFQKTRALTQDLWTKLWFDKNFHALLMVGALLKSHAVPMLFYVIYILKFSIKLCKVVLHVVAPRLGDLSSPTNEALHVVIRNEEIAFTIAL